jgi:CBS domain-containing protein
MKKNNISQVLVTDNNDKYKGIVHILDIIKQGINDE